MFLKSCAHKSSITHKNRQEKLYRYLPLFSTARFNNFRSIPVFPCDNSPRYDATVSSFGLSVNRRNIRRFVAVRNTLWSGKCTQPRKSTPEAKVLIKTLSG